MKIPRYQAYIKRFIYKPVIEYRNSPAYTYDRLQPFNETVADFSALSVHTPPTYSFTQPWTPIMANPAPYGNEIDSEEANDGRAGPYSVYELAGPELMDYIDDIWTIQRLMQKQIPLWQESIANHALFLDALRERTADDVWLTSFKHYSYNMYNNDRNVDSYSKKTSVASINNVYDIPIERVTFDPEDFSELRGPEINARVTPCEQYYFLTASRALWRLYRDSSNFVAIEADEAPFVEKVPLVDVSTPYSIETTGITIPEEERLLIQLSYYPEIQPYFWNNGYRNSAELLAEREAAALATIAGFETSLGDNFRYFVAPIFLVNQTLNFINGLTANGDTTLSLNQYFSNWATYLTNATDETVTLQGNLYTLEEFNDALGVWEPLTTINTSTFFRTKKPKPWDHTDPDFEGYVPFFGSAWRFNISQIRAYAQNPDARFDGMVFAYMVEVKEIIRNWSSYIYWERDDSTEIPPTEFLPCLLQSNGLVDILTGEVTDEGTCFHITPVEFRLSDYLTEEWLGFSPGPGYPWGELPPIVVSPGEFFLEDGSDAPLYPTFTGAYVYDNHLQKWGKFDANYKRLIDYQSVNNYAPGTQSFERFGIYAGIVDADGVIRLFDENPINSQLVYGKVGYYRQGMSTLEEIRAHHRIPVSGTIATAGSVEGKLLTTGFYQEQSFSNSPSWQLNGGYSAKWHNIYINGKFDLTYLEYRGLRQGRR